MSGGAEEKVIAPHEHEEKASAHGLDEKIAAHPLDFEAGGSRKAVALNLVENPLRVSTAFPFSAHLAVH